MRNVQTVSLRKAVVVGWRNINSIEDHFSRRHGVGDGAAGRQTGTSRRVTGYKEKPYATTCFGVKMKNMSLNIIIILCIYGVHLLL